MWFWLWLWLGRRSRPPYWRYLPKAPREWHAYRPWEIVLYTWAGFAAVWRVLAIFVPGWVAALAVLPFLAWSLWAEREAWRACS